MNTYTCELCMGTIEERDGAVYHVLTRVIVGPNPHEGWWRDNMQGPRYLCDECYAENIHGTFDYGAPAYTPRYRALLHDEARLHRDAAQEEER